MHRIGIPCILFCAFAVFAPAAQSPPQSPDVQEKVAAAREAAARNQEALQQYSWISTTRISVKGEVKNTKIEQCRYGADGTVEKTELSEPPPQQQSAGRGRRRGDLIKKAVVAHKTGEMQAEMEAAGALVHGYLPPDPDKIQGVVAAGGVTVSSSPGGQAVIRLANYEKEGDALTLTLNTEALSLLSVSIDTWLDEPDKVVTLNVQFDTLADGTSYPATTVLAIPDDEIEVHIENSNYQKLSR